MSIITQGVCSMAKLSFRVSAQEIRKAVRDKVDGPIIALTKNPDVMRSIAHEAIRLMTPYVPKKSGDLRDSGHVRQNSKGTYITWGHPAFGKTQLYAAYQHDADDTLWKRTTPGTTSHWTEKIAPGTPAFEQLVNYAAPIMKKEVGRGGR